MQAVGGHNSDFSTRLKDLYTVQCNNHAEVRIRRGDVRGGDMNLPDPMSLVDASGRQMISTMTNIGPNAPLVKSRCDYVCFGVNKRRAPMGQRMHYFKAPRLALVTMFPELDSRQTVQLVEPVATVDGAVDPRHCKLLKVKRTLNFLEIHPLTV